MDFKKRSALLLVAAGPCLAHCAPNFDVLSAGNPAAAQGGDAASAGNNPLGQSGGGNASIGGAPAMGGSTGTSAGAGSTSASGGAPSGGAAGGEAGQATAAGAENGGATSGGATSGGATSGGATSGGSGGQQGCVTPHAGQLGYNDFDTGLSSAFFPGAPHVSCTMQTLNNATCSEQWDSAAGQTCPGALQFSVLFKAYPSGTAPNEITSGALDFAFADWSGAVALHVSVKVSPANAPISGVRFFVQSGDDFAYDGPPFDGTDFKTGNWHERVFTFAGSILDFTKIRRIGTQIALDRAEMAGIPAEPPPIEVLVDDAWLEPK